MSWKVRRAHYYAQQRGGGPSPEVSKRLNLLFLISLILSLIFFVQALGDPNNQVDFLLAIGALSLITTPILFLFFLNGIQYGLPNLARGTAKGHKSNKVGFNEKLENDPDLNTNDWDLHKRRLDKFGRSQYRKTTFYIGPKGGVYYITYRGTKVYC